jgi:uncharacterized protein YbjQ (UPF0145 family)
MKNPPNEKEKNIEMTTAMLPPYSSLQMLGIVTAACVVSRSIIKDFGATIKNTTGGELKTYSELLNNAAEKAFERLAQKAEQMGADGVFGVQVACPQVAGGAAEILVVGTAYRKTK